MLRLVLVILLLGSSVFVEAAQGQDDGVSLGVTYTADGLANVRGGAERGVATLDNLDLTATLRLGPLVGLDRTTLFLYGLGNHGQSASELVGDLQGVDNIEAPRAWRLYEVHLTHRLPGDRVSVRAGLYDVNSEFDVLPSALLFLNSSFGIGAEYALSREQGPSIFPVTSLGVRVRAEPAAGWYALGAVLDGVPGNPASPGSQPFLFEDNDGLLLSGETGRVVGDPDAPRGKVGVGGWYYTARFARLNAPGRQQGNGGAYLLGQWRLFAENAPAKDAPTGNAPTGDAPAEKASGDGATQGLTGFAQAGVAESDVNRVGAYTGAGLVYTGLIPGRPADRAGVGLAVAHTSDAFEAQREAAGADVDAAEYAWEATYAAPVFDWLTLQGDAQYVVNPSMQPARDNALLLGMRLVVDV